MHTKIRAMDKMLINNNNFKFFFQEYFEPVFQFARKYTENDAIARDFTQDAFIKLYEIYTLSLHDALPILKISKSLKKPNLSFTRRLAIFA